MTVQVQEVLKLAPGLLWHSDDVHRVSISGLTELLATLCMVVVLKGEGGISQRLRCSCMLASKGGKCSHMAISCFLHGEYKEYFHELIECTRKRPTSPEDLLLRVENRKRPVSRAKVPNATALKRLSQIAREASVKYKRRQRSEQDTDVFESTPVKKKVKMDDPVEIRRETLRAVARKVESDEFQQMFSGLHMIQNENVSVREAEEHLIRKKVEEMKDSKQVSMRSLAGKVIRTWMSQEGSL